MAVVGSIAEQLELSAPGKDDIEAVHRIKGKKDAAPTILVRFTRREMKEKWMEKRNILVKDEIYISDNLTARWKKLLWLTKKRAKDRQYRYVWMANDCIFVRKVEGSTVIRIKNKEGLSTIV